MGRLNKPAQPGFKYRSPNQTNAKDLTPNLMEDVIASQDADAERMRKGVSPSASSDINRRRQQEAGGRATARSLGRAGLLEGAFTTGLAIGDKINRNYPEVGEAVDRGIEKSGLGKAIERASVKPGRVELTDEAKQRIEDEEATNDVIRARKKVAEDRGETYARGGFVKKADGIAKRGKTKGRFV